MSAWQARLTYRIASAETAALILISWHVTGAAKTTTITHESGAQLVLDHTAVACYLIIDCRVSDLFGADAGIRGRERHYQAPHQSWLAEGRPITTAEEHMLLLHDLLLQPAKAPLASLVRSRRAERGVGAEDPLTDSR